MIRASVPDYFRDDFCTAAKQSGGGEVLETAILVGANIEGPDDDGATVLGTIDAAYLVNAARIAGQYGFRLSDNLDIQVCNGRYGHDILESEAKAALVMFCYIYFNPQDRASFRTEQAGTHMYCWQSPKAHEHSNWHGSLLRTQARMAINVREQAHDFNTEVPTEILAQRPYEWVNRWNQDAMRHPVQRNLVQAYDVLVRR